MSICRRGCLVVLVAMSATLLLLYVARDRLLPAVAVWLDVGGPPEVADAVLLLNGGVNDRPFAAGVLVREGWARQVVVCSVAPSRQVRDGTALSWTEMNRGVLRHCGVPDEDIVVLDAEVRTTFDEAVAVADWLDSSPGARLLVVTEGPHTRRARWILTRVLGDRARRISMISAPTDEFQTDVWWQNELGLTYIVSEYLKLGFYGVCYGWLGYEAIACAVIALVLWRYGRRRLHRRRDLLKAKAASDA